MAKNAGKESYQFNEPATMEIDGQISQNLSVDANLPSASDLLKVKSLFDGKEILDCFALMYLKHDEAIKGVRREMTELKTRVSELETAAENTQQDIQDIFETSLPQIKESVLEEKKNRLKLDLWGRKWNLVIIGIPGSIRETARESERAFRKMLTEALKFEADRANSILLQAAHRLPGGTPEKRHMIVRFSSLMDRDDILEAARKLPRGTGLGVVPDLPPETGDLRSKLLKQKKRSARGITQENETCLHQKVSFRGPQKVILDSEL